MLWGAITAIPLIAAYVSCSRHTSDVIAYAVSGAASTRTPTLAIRRTPTSLTVVTAYDACRDATAVTGLGIIRVGAMNYAFAPHTFRIWTTAFRAAAFIACRAAS